MFESIRKAYHLLRSFPMIREVCRLGYDLVPAGSQLHPNPEVRREHYRGFRVIDSKGREEIFRPTRELGIVEEKRILQTLYDRGYTVECVWVEEQYRSRECIDWVYEERYYNFWGYIHNA